MARPLNARERAQDAAAAQSVTRDDLLALQITGVHGRLENIEKTLVSLSANMSALVRLEERHAALEKGFDHIHSEVHQQENRLIANDAVLAEIKGNIAPLTEARKWVVMAMIGIISLVAIGAFNAVNNLLTRQAVVKPEPRWQTTPPAMTLQPPQEYESH